MWRKVELLLELLATVSLGGLDAPEGANLVLTEAACRRLLKSQK